MSQPFKVHDVNSAPEESRAVLEGVRRSYGFVPNLMGVLAESPVALRAYAELAKILDSGRLDPRERQVVLLSISVANRCRYCVAAHSGVASAAGVPQEVIRAIREEQPVAEPRLAALNVLARGLVERRGWLPEAEVEQFLAAGFERAHLLEVLTALAMKTISNYTNHLAETPLDTMFGELAWTPLEAA